MIKLGIISAATYGATYRGENVPRTPGSFHGTAFSSTYNGFDAVKAKHLFPSLLFLAKHRMTELRRKRILWNWTFATAERRIPGAQIVKIWDPNREWAERLAELLHFTSVRHNRSLC